MNENDLIFVIEREFEKANEIFFSYAWRVKLSKLLNGEKKYSKLVTWMDDRIELNLNLINLFNPSDKTKQYKIEDFNTYRKACEEFAMLINMKSIILNEKCNMQMRKNIEYAICKYFNVHYDDMLNRYV